MQALIDAYGRGEIELEKVAVKRKKTELRYDPPGSADHPYTKSTVARALGWTKSKQREPDYKCSVAFDLLDAVGEGILTRKQLRGIKRQVADEIVNQAMSVKRANERLAKAKEAEAKKARKVSEELEYAAEADPDARQPGSVAGALARPEQR